MNEQIYYESPKLELIPVRFLHWMQNQNGEGYTPVVSFCDNDKGFSPNRPFAVQARFLVKSLRTGAHSRASCVPRREKINTEPFNGIIPFL